MIHLLLRVTRGRLHAIDTMAPHSMISQLVIYQLAEAAPLLRLQSLCSMKFKNLTTVANFKYRRRAPNQAWAILLLSQAMQISTCLFLADLNDTDKLKTYNGFTLHMSQCMAQRVWGPEFNTVCTVLFPLDHVYTDTHWYLFLFLFILFKI